MSCIAYTVILKNCKYNTGNEALSFISYARKFTDKPRECFRGELINNELYLDPVPTGQLPLDMPTKEFILKAEDRLRSLPNSDHHPCYLLKRELSDAMISKFSDQP